MVNVVEQEEQAFLHLQLTAEGLKKGTLISTEIIGNRFQTSLSLSVGEDRKVPIKLGEYLVTAYMPSGKTISQEASVVKGKENLVELKFSESYHGWQHYLEIENTDQDKSARVSDFPATWQKLWDYNGEFVQELLWPSQWKTPVNQRVVKYNLSLEVNQQRIHFLQIGGEQLPWRLTALPPYSELQVLVYPSEGRIDFDDDLAVAVASHDLQAETLLGYLISGRLKAAKIIADKLLAEQSLLFENPIKAVILGYYLLKIEDGNRYQELLEQLVNQVDWLPDLPVILAWQLLRANKPKVDLIRQYLLEAVKRGIPIYSQGLQLLFDGLRLIKQDAIARELQASDIEAAVKLIQEYTNATDWSQPLTTFYGDSPQKPSLSLIKGIPERQEHIVWLTEKKTPSFDKQKPSIPPNQDVEPENFSKKIPLLQPLLSCFNRLIGKLFKSKSPTTTAPQTETTPKAITSLSGAMPKFGGSTGGLLTAAEVEEKYAITWTSSKEQVFEMPTGGAAIMNKGENLLYLARKEQCLALGAQLRTKFKPKIQDYKIYRVFPNDEIQYLHPADGVFPETVNEGRESINRKDRKIGDNPEPATIRYSGKAPYEC